MVHEQAASLVLCLPAAVEKLTAAAEPPTPAVENSITMPLVLPVHVSPFHSYQPATLPRKPSIVYFDMPIVVPSPGT